MAFMTPPHHLVGFFCNGDQSCVDDDFNRITLGWSESRYTCLLLVASVSELSVQLYIVQLKVQTFVVVANTAVTKHFHQKYCKHAKVIGEKNFLLEPATQNSCAYALGMKNQLLWFLKHLFLRILIVILTLNVRFSSLTCFSLNF